MATDGTHLSAATVAAYVQGELEAEVRIRCEEHLATCATCRQELVSVADLMARRRREKLARNAGGAAVVAALMLGVGVLARPVRTALEEPEVVRAPSLAAAGTIEPITPRVDETLEHGAGTRFAWHAVPGGSTYRLSLLDESGALWWSLETGDTVATLPDSLRLGPSGTFFWYVDALSADGSTLTSGALRFRLK